MSNLSIESTKEQEESRGDSQIQSSKSKESKFESKQPTNIEFQLPGLLDLSILTKKHFQEVGKEGYKPVSLIAQFLSLNNEQPAVISSLSSETTEYKYWMRISLTKCLLVKKEVNQVN